MPINAKPTQADLAIAREVVRYTMRGPKGVGCHHTGADEHLADALAIRLVTSRVAAVNGSHRKGRWSPLRFRLYQCVSLRFG